ncbi:cytochrome P450 [Panus rudis PR-1116 ss-1]|nr:cytochrome P450 [Panus rudis PR-1116 ss-1]
MRPTPGIIYLSTRLHRVVIPLALVYATIHIARSKGYSFPTWAVVATYVLSFPLLVVAADFLKYRRNERNAAARNAVLPKRVKAKLPGGLDLLSRMQKNFHTRFLGSIFYDWAHEYGYTFNFRLLGEDRIFTAEPEHIKMILATEFNNYEKGPLFRFQMDTLLGTGVFNSDGDMWKFHRSMTRPFFSKDRISHFDIFDRHAEDALNQLRERMKEGQAIDWQDLVSRFTLDSATEFLFGQDVRSLSARLPYPSTSPLSRIPEEPSLANDFSKAFLEAQLNSSSRSRKTAAWPVTEIFSDSVAGPMKVIDSFIDPILKDALEKKAAGGGGGGVGEKDVKSVAEDETLLGHLVKLTDDPKILKDETLNILLAGRDTTAATLTFAIYKLSEHPDILHRLREEILSKVGSSRRPTYDDIREMKYLRAFINEVLRLYPAVPFNVRFSINDSIWPSKPGLPPYYIPPRTRCVYSVAVMHRRKDLWGPDALEFDPDRFLDERCSKYLTPNPFIFLPFNAGPRICLGQQFAYNETSFMLIRLLQQFSSIELVQQVHPESIPPPGYSESKGSNGKDDKIWLMNHLTSCVKGGLWVKMSEATATESV